MNLPVPLRRLALIAALGAGLLGGGNLAIWAFGDWHVLSLGAGYIPMAPITAVLFVLLGFGLAAMHDRPEARAVRLFSSAGAWLALLVGALTLVLMARGYPVPWEHWLLKPADRLNQLPLGHMSRVTAWMFLFTGGILLLEARRPAQLPWVRRLSSYVAVGACGLSGFVVASYASGAPLFYGQASAPMALLTAIAFIAINGSILLAGPVADFLRQWQAEADQLKVPVDYWSFLRKLLLAGGTLGLLISIGTVLYLRKQENLARQEIYQQLEAIAGLKAQQINEWRNERLGEAFFLTLSPSVVRDINAFMAAPDDPEARARLLDWLIPIKGGDRYAALRVLDRSGRVLLAVPPESKAADSESAATLVRLFAGREMAFRDFHRDGPEGAPQLDLLVPITTSHAAGPAAPTDVLIVMQLDPRRFLYPLIRDWPLPSETGESLLVRREGDEVVYLNDLRFRAGAALNIRHSVHDLSLPAARAVRGETGVFEGIDYRGVPVLAAIKPVPNSPWFLIAKMDQTEAYAKIRRDMWQTLIASVLLLLAGTLVGMGFWRARHSGFLKQRLGLEVERNALADRLSLVTQHANDIILLMDEKGMVLEANERALASYGYSLAELRALPCGGLRPEIGRHDLPEQLASILAEDGAVFETFHRRKDGSVFPVEVSGRAVSIGGQRRLLGIYRDITVRKAHELEIERLNRIHKVASEVNQAMVRIRNRDELFAVICRVLVEDGGFRTAWIGWRNPQTQSIEPVAVAGDEHGYVADLLISTDPATEWGRGPSGTAFRSGRVKVCNDFFADPLTGPWREKAARSGFQSSIALPLREEGQVVGLLTVYAAERDFFQSREVELLEGTVADVAFALDVFAGEQRRRDADAAVQASERRLQFLLTSTKVVIYSLRIDQGFATNFLSPNVRALLGYPATTVIQADFWRQHVHPDDGAAAHAALTDLLKATGTDKLTREYRFRHADGTWRWMHDETRLIRDAAGLPLELVGSWIDITDRKLAEVQLIKLSQAVEQSPASIVITDLDGAIEYVNPCFTQLTGYGMEEVRGQNPRVLKSGYTAPEVYREMWTTLREGRVWRGDLHNKKKNGELYTEAAVIAPVFDAAGRTTHFVAIKDDITERLRAATAAREVLEHFNSELEQKVAFRTEELDARNRQIEALLKAVPDTVIRMRSDKKLLFSKATHSSAPLAAITPQEGKPVEQTAAELLQASLAVGIQTLANRSTVNIEAQIATPTGPLIVELRAAPTGTDEFVVFARDITDRKRLEAETAALLEKEHQLSEMKTRFISVTSHEFRTPMAAAMGSVELLVNHYDQLSPVKRTELFARVNASLHRMTEMLDDVLTLNRLESDRVVVHLQEVDLHHFLRNVIEEIRLGDRDAHQFDLRAPAVVAPFPTDVHLLRPILTNLLSNAVRYSPVDSNVIVRLETAAGQLNLSVEDQGVGIPAAEFTRIFEPFERGSNVTHIKGTGLGLNIVQRMTHMLGGTITLTSTEGRGSCFSLTFPLPPTV